MEAGRRFEGADRTSDIVKALRVRERSVEQWRRNWRETRPGGSAVEGAREAAEAVGRAVRPARNGVGEGAGRKRMGRPAMDTGTRQDPDWPPVPGQLPVRGTEADGAGRVAAAADQAGAGFGSGGRDHRSPRLRETRCRGPGQRQQPQRGTGEDRAARRRARRGQGPTGRGRHLRAPTGSSNEPDLSRGTAISTGPDSVITVLDQCPLR